MVPQVRFSREADDGVHDGENGFDLVVFGAGPGGMGAAYYAAKLGLRVLMIEKDRLPRDRV